MTVNRYAIQAWNGRDWRTVRGAGPFNDFVVWEDGTPRVVPRGQAAAYRAAANRSNPKLRRPSSTEGMPHRVIALKPETRDVDTLKPTANTADDQTEGR